MPLLTVAIPTFNRLQWLKRTLPAIIEQAQAFPAGEIEVVISDNCSSDGTWDYLLQMSKQAEFLRLHRNEANIGGEANFYLLPRLTSGHYLWMIGDDDLVNAGALNRIVESLADAPDYLVVNYDAYDSALQKCMRANSLCVSRDEELRTREDCLSRVDAMAMSFISMWVGRRDFFNLLSEEEYRYFANWGMSIQADRYLGISRFPRGRLLATACLRARFNTEFKEEQYFAWFLHGTAEVLRYAYSAGILSKAVVRERRSRLLRRDALQRIRYERRTGQLRRSETYRLLRADYGDLPVFWLLCVPMMFAPGLGTMLKLGRWVLGRS